MSRLNLSQESQMILKDAQKKINNIRLILFRKEPSIKKLKKPTNVDSAHRLGYKEIPGYFVVRVRTPKGGRRKPRPRSGRRPKHLGSVLFTPGLSRRKIAEGRANRRYENMRVLGSYKIAEDGKHIWFEVMMSDESRIKK